MKNKILRNLTAVVLVATLAASVGAQGVNLNGLHVQPFGATHAGDIITAVSTDVGIYVKYVGTNAAAATVAVDAATGDLTFLDSGAATDDFECPVSGALGGVIDVSDAACNTLGEVVDVINQSNDWVAVIAGGLRSDSSNNTLITLATTSAKAPEGVGLLKDTAVALNVTNVVLPISNGGRNEGIVNWMASPSKVATNAFVDSATTVLFASENVTSSGAVGNFQVICVKETYTAAGTGSTEVTQVLYTEAGAATTVTGTFNELVNGGGVTCLGGKAIVRISATTDLTAPLVFSTGYRRSLRF